MRLKRVQLIGFKRFDNLTIDLGPDPPRVIALVGPNGCGKSSVFDAFEEKTKNMRGAQANEAPSFFSKHAYSPDPASRTTDYVRNDSIGLTFADGSTELTKTSFHIRSAYRFTSKLDVQQLAAQPDLVEDTSRPTSSISLDGRLKENYERLLGQAFENFFDNRQLTGQQVLDALTGKINVILKNVLEIQISDLGNVIKREGQLYFDKADSKRFPYQNLSAGEKEVVDLVIDLVVRSTLFSSTVYCIDEPELHINSAIQRRLLIEIEKLVPEGCQLWIATHSIGFLRALQKDLSDRCAVLDFSEKPYFQGVHTIVPMVPSRRQWQRIFSTALDDLVELVAPRTIVYCEGREDPGTDAAELGLDATVYNEIFAGTHPDTLFVSSGGGGAMTKNSILALKVLGKALTGVEFLLLRDRDGKSDVERLAFLSEAPMHRMLERHEIRELSPRRRGAAQFLHHQCCDVPGSGLRCRSHERK